MMMLLLRVVIAFLLGAGAVLAIHRIVERGWRVGLALSIRRVRRRVLGLNKTSPRDVAALFGLSVFVPFLICFAFGLSPLFGLAGAVFLPLLFIGLLSYRMGRRTESLQDSSLSSLYVLKGLVKSGVGLTAALQQVSTMENNPFCRALWTVLGRYERGQPMGKCLDNLRRESKLGPTAHFISLIEMSYRNGLPMVPLLESMLQFLEAHQEMEKRVKSVTASSMVQALFACLMPWGLLAALYWFDPEMVSHFMSSSWVYFLPLPILLESIGGVFLWRISSYF